MERLTIQGARKLLEDRQTSPAELFQYYKTQIEKRNGELNAFLSVAEEPLQEVADGPLAGVPIAIKDNILVRGMRSTAGSRVLEHYTASYDATAVRRLKEAGAVIIGKTNLDEFAMGASTENSAYGPSKNPYDVTRVPGGSSGGSAVAVAADMCVAALGSETGGSVRQPASFCGVVGLKPTYGEVSRHGLIALTSSLDQIGPMGRTVGDVRTLFSIIRGQDLFDATSLPPEEGLEHVKDVADLTIGLPKEYFELEGLQPEVKEAVMKAVQWFEEQGATIQEVSLPYTEAGLATYYVLTPAEASSNLARYDGIKYGLREDAPELWEQYRKTRGAGLGPEPTRRVMIGTYVLSAGYYDAYYKKAVAAREHIKKDFVAAFKEVDVLMTPTTPTVAFKLGEKANDPLAMYAADVFTVPVNIAGVPGLSLPCGTHEGLPIGLQFIAPWRQEGLLLSLGEQYEEAHT